MIDLPDIIGISTLAVYALAVIALVLIVKYIRK